ncbi:MAG: S8 family peptidase [Sedimentisphaerales bacterium]|nr:S8 family peptidase [Sedimentisphaerales bacterium]
MAVERLPHIFLNDSAEQSNYTSPAGGGGQLHIPKRHRQQHSKRLMSQFENAWSSARQTVEQRTAVSLPTKSGIYLEFKSQADADLVIQSLENIQSGIRLLNVKEIDQADAKVIVATVYIPQGKESYFLKKIQQYSKEDTKTGKPRHERLINSIEDIRLAILESFWQDPLDLIPIKTAKWCEIWLRTGVTKEEAKEAIEEFKALCASLEIGYQNETLFFPERAVILVKADSKALNNLIESSDSIAELRLAKETAEFWVELSPKEQAQWVQDLRGRLRVNTNTKVALTILDTGVNNGHELLSPILADDDCHSHKQEWGTEDHDGHGTNMAGLAIYGDLQSQLGYSNQVEINHKLESVKILPPHGDNDPKEWGAITQQAISRVEIKSANLTHISCMAVTAPEDVDHDKYGRPSSWSAAIDDITSGSFDDNQRLFIVSAGNVRDRQDYMAYPDSNQTKSVENPGQSWNALTVGAYTIKEKISDPERQDHEILAPAGGLSPYSTTSLIWDKKKWPYKPEIVFEGGNLSKAPDGFIGNLEDLELLTTYYKITERQFDTIHGTSAATAQAAWMAAQIQAVYPEAWPETIRALIIHSAQWTNTMKQQFGINDDSSKSDIANMLRVCGYGLPDINKAMWCANNSLTLIAQEYLQPFDKKDSGSVYCTKDMHIHELPWPKEVLLELGETPVELKVTLSYFIEPGPGEIGWRDRYRYASHALRFDVNSVNEDRRDFLARLNNAARDAEYNRDTAPDSGSDRWLIGSQNRKLGTVHSDIWRGNAANIATCNLIGIYPVIGWWRERHHLGRWNRKTRYSLIVSLHTPEQAVDLYTPVANMLKIPVSIRI